MKLNCEGAEANVAALQIYLNELQTYLDAGALYGDTHEGFMRWSGEMAELRAAEQRARDIRLHHETLSTMKQHVTSRQALESGRQQLHALEQGVAP